MTSADTNARRSPATARSGKNDRSRSLRGGACFWLVCMFVLLSPCASQALPSDGPATQYSVSIWTIDNGLPQGTINDIFQAADGALWIATNGGLLRFDGAEFRTYDFDTLPDLPSVRFTGLEHDGAGGLWIVTQQGDLLLFQDGKISRTLAVPNPDRQDVLSIVSDKPGGGGGLWI